MSLDADYIVNQGIKIAQAAKESGLTLRLLGAGAIRHHCLAHVKLLTDLVRHLSDVDFAGFSREQSGLSRVLKTFGYDERRSLSMGLTGRLMYASPTAGLSVDVFLDELKMCHVIKLKDRLDRDYPTISLADLFLEKMQIVQINEKDLKDVAVLLREHDLGNNDHETINSTYIADLLSQDWGFYYTVTNNLDRLSPYVQSNSVIPADDKRNIIAKIEALHEGLEAQPKSMRWKARARIGTKRRWYNDVENVSR